MRDVEGVEDCMKWRSVTRAWQTECLGKCYQKVISYLRSNLTPKFTEILLSTSVPTAHKTQCVSMSKPKTLLSLQGNNTCLLRQRYETYTQSHTRTHTQGYGNF